jgi:hypothetical protein
LFVRILTLRETDFQPQLFHLQHRFGIATRIIDWVVGMLGLS